MLKGQRSDFADWAGVFCDLAVGGEEGDAFHRGLGDQETVEGVFVQGRKALDGDAVLAGDWEFRIAIGEKVAAKSARVELEVVSPKSSFDRHLPYAQGAEEQLIVWIDEERDREF